MIHKLPWSREETELMDGFVKEGGNDLVTDQKMLDKKINLERSDRRDFRHICEFWVQ